jgi:hypothetical protein
MLRKRIILFAVLLVIGLQVVQAEETVADKTLIMPFLPQYSVEKMFNLTPMAYPSSVAGKLGMSFLNIFFGLGSWISGDWKNGIQLTMYQGGGLALVLWAATWDREAYYWLVPIAVPVCGIFFWAGGVLAGFFTPFTGVRTAQFNDPSNWTVALFPNKKGSIAGTLAFTAHF